MRPGGRIAISDIALTRELPRDIRTSLEAYVGCVAGAILVDEYKKIVEASGLKEVDITVRDTSGCGEPDGAPVSIDVVGHKYRYSFS